ncbi:MAG: hypothetical protein ACI84E_000286 [Planctomycetota bacterium]|jgi:hypothetical protein
MHFQGNPSTNFRALGLAGLGLALAVSGGCAESSPLPPPFVLESFHQSGQDGVLLNEPLVFHFSDELDPSSITGASARILDSLGKPILGQFDVRLDQLVFQPKLPLQRDLQDGGLRPGEQYTCELRGFPLISGVRSRDGRILDSGFQASFTTAPDQSDTRLFLDGTPDQAAPLSLVQMTIGGAEPIRLVISEPLDPRGVDGRAFDLQGFRELSRGESGEDFQLEAIAVQAVLVENTPEGARVELRAVEGQPGEAQFPRVLEQGEYHLVVREAADGIPGEGAGVFDFGGHPVRSAWALSQLPATLEVGAFRGTGGNRFHRFEFLSRDMRSPAEVPGCDGMALWGGAGFVGIRLPRSAGNGSAGAMDLGAGKELIRAAGNDLNGSRITIGTGRELDLSASAGCVVLRSQGAMRISGDLTRLSETGQAARGAEETWGQWHGRLQSLEITTPSMSFGLGEGLDAWIAKAKQAGNNWTVLVSGGDLIIDGDLRLDGPLLLAAGGRVRIAGSIEAREIWIVGDGGGANLQPMAKSAEFRNAGRSPMLHFEEPEGNPLVVPIKVAVLSSPIRPSGEKIKWRMASIGARQGAGMVRVRFLGERDLPGGGVESIGPVDDLSLLDRCGAVRLWIELEASPGPMWDPPMLDFVELSWNEEKGS